jgi:hypothetical protein
MQINCGYNYETSYIDNYQIISKLRPCLGLYSNRTKFKPKNQGTIARLKWNTEISPAVILQISLNEARRSDCSIISNMISSSPSMSVLLSKLYSLRMHCRSLSLIHSCATWDKRRIEADYPDRIWILSGPFRPKIGSA